MYRRIDADGDNTIYTLEREPVRNPGKATVGVIPRSVRFNRGAGVITAYRYTESCDDGEMHSAMLELSGYGMRKLSRAMRLSQQLVTLSSKIQAYRSVLTDFAVDGGRKSQFGPYVSLVSGGDGDGGVRKKLYNLLNIGEEGRLEGIDWVMSVPKRGGPYPVLYSYRAARMTDKARRNADLVDATLPDPVTGKLRGGIRIRCTRAEYIALVKKLAMDQELRWASIALKKSMMPVRSDGRHDDRMKLVGARVRNLGDDTPMRRRPV